MVSFFAKKPTLDELGESIKPTIESRDESKIAKLLDDIISHSKADPEKVEGLLGWGILIACEFKINCVGEYLHRFMKTYPASISPVKVEYALFLANTDKPDSATQFAREYLRLVFDAGHVPNLSNMPIARRGCSKAFIVMTAVYTYLGARSYSHRILQVASRLPLDSDYLAHYQVEQGRLLGELQQPEIKQMDDMWEAFFRQGANAGQLYTKCSTNNCPMMAKRVELIEGNFRFNANYRVDANEMLQLITIMKMSDGKEADALT